MRAAQCPVVPACPACPGLSCPACPPCPGAPAPVDGSAGGLIQQAEEDVLRLSARLAERDMEAKRMLRQLEHSQAVVRSRDAKVAELSRRVAQLSSSRP